MFKNKSYLLMLVMVFVFFLLNTLWISVDNQLPMIGDDARWLEETNRLTQTIKTGDVGLIWQKWQDLFIKDTNSFPRTPLFVLMSVPVFMVVGPSENSAIIFNAFVFALSCILSYFFCVKIFENNKNKEKIGLVTVLLFNLFPAHYGFARLYMSEVLQTFFVIGTSFFIYHNLNKFSLKTWFGLGVFLSLAMLLRFIMPIYLGLPVIYFAFRQYKIIKKAKKNQGLKYTVLVGFVFLLSFLPIFLSWYGKNLITYWEFTKFTSSGELAAISSLGPVFSIVTVLKFWKIIALWHFGWPLLAVIFGMIAILLIKKPKIKKNFLKHIFTSNQDNKILLALFILPLPALITATLSLNKTTRYYIPVEFFWIIVFAFLFVCAWEHKRKTIKVYIIVSMIFLSYQYMQAFLPNVRLLPQTGLIFSIGHYVSSDNVQNKYDYLYKFFKFELQNNKEAKIYLVPEQTTLNDAELIWYFTQKGERLNTIGEFSAYHTYEQGLAKVEETNYVIVNTKPVLSAKYNFPYSHLVSKIRSGDFLKVSTDQDLGITIYLRIN